MKYKHVLQHAVASYISYSCLLLLVSILATSSRAQQRINGLVLDQETEKPLSGAQVELLSLHQTAATKADGTFSLSVDKLPVTIAVHAIGYQSTTQVLNHLPELLTISLEEEQSFLEEVVITGYSERQRKNLSGSLATVKFDEYSQHQADTDPIKLLQGKAAGVQITSTSGSPGGGVSFVIRGNNSIGGDVSPLYVVDGVFINTAIPVSGNGGNLLSNPIADINPADIASITVLKDAMATAIYGAQGSNGVVVITTKRGGRNTPTRIQLNAKQGISHAVNKFRSVTGPETGQLLYESWANTASDYGERLETYLLRERPTDWNLVFPFTAADGSPDFTRNNIANLPTYDRVSDLFQTANLADYHVTLAGGTPSSNHFIGLGYVNQQSIVRPNTFERFSGRINYDNQVTDVLKIGTSYATARVQRSRLRNNDNDAQGLINSAIFPRSFLPVFDELGNYLNHATFNNHLRLIDHIDNTFTTWRNTLNIFGEYDFTPALKFRSSASLDYTSNQSRNFLDLSLSNNGLAEVGNHQTQVYLAEQLLTYRKQFNADHHLNVLLGNTVYVRQAEGVSATGSNYVFDELREVSSGGVTTGSSLRNENRLVSFFGNTGYTFREKYGLEFNFRADGSSRFGSNVRWGYFPAAGLIWNAGEENFIRSLNLFDALRLRGSFGIAGNQNGIGDYDALGIWVTEGQTYLDRPSLSPLRLANPNLTWETTRQTNVGLDFSFFGNRLNASLEGYYKYTSNGLQEITVPSRSGYARMLSNYSEISNKGLELTINSTNIQRGAFTWTTDFNISTNRNRIERIPQEQTFGATNRGTSILREGYPVNSYFLYKQLYVDPQTGNAVYEDLDGDGIITYADRQIVGNAQPRFIAGLTNTFVYKNFDLNIFFYATQGNKILSMHNFFLVHGGVLNGIGFDPRQLDRWQRPGDITDIPRPTRYTANPEQNNSPANNYTGQVASLSSRYVDDGSFLRLRNLSVGYTLPNRVAQKLNVHGLKATFSATNLWTLTRYKGLDPEVSAQSSNQNTAGYDWATIPQPRSFELVLNLTL